MLLSLLGVSSESLIEVVYYYTLVFEMLENDNTAFNDKRINARYGWSIYLVSFYQFIFTCLLNWKVCVSGMFITIQACQNKGCLTTVWSFTVIQQNNLFLCFPLVSAFKLLLSLNLKGNIRTLAVHLTFQKPVVGQYLLRHFIIETRKIYRLIN